MSLQWPETLMNIGLGTLYGNELRILIHPNAIELSLLKRDFMHGFKAQKVKHQLLESADKSSAQALSADMLRKLSTALQNRMWHGAAPVVVLANTFVRYAVLPWNAEIKTKSEQKAYLQHVFAQHYGEQSKTWHLSAHQAGFGKAAIASGAERSLLVQLQTAFASANLPFKAVHPLLMLATNQALSHLKKSGLPQSFWLLSAEDCRLTLALAESGDWKRVWNIAAEDRLGLQLQRIIQREALLDQALLQLPVLQYGSGERVEQVRVIYLDDTTQQDSFAHSVQPRWAVR